MCLLEENEYNSSHQGGPSMTSIADNAVKIQTTSESNFSTPSWFGEVVLLSSYLQKHGVLSKINEQVPPGECSTSMGRERQLGSARCPRPMSFLRPFAG